MNPLNSLGCALFALFLTVETGLSQWVQVGPSGFLSCLLKTPAGLFVGSAGAGIYFSSDNGISWRDANLGLTSHNVTGMTNIGQDVFASTRGGGVLLTTDNGATWAPVNSMLISQDVGCVTAIGTGLFAGPTGYGAFFSPDRGATWQPLGKGLAMETVNAFFSKDSRVFAGTMQGVYVTSDGGKNWFSSNAGLPANGRVTAFASTDTLIFAGVHNGGVYISTDNGVSWSTAGAGLTDSNVTCLASVVLPGSTARRLLAGTARRGLFASTDNGTNWTPVDLGLSSLQVDALASDGSVVFAALEEGVRVSSDAGLHWGEAGTGTPTRLVTGLGLVGTNLYVGTNRSGVYLTADMGNTWAPVNRGLTGYDISAMTVAGATLFVGTPGGRLFRRETSDSNWFAASSQFANLPFNVLGVAGNVLLANPGFRGIHYSTDIGANWLYGQGSEADQNGTSFLSFAAGQGYIFAGSLNLGAFRSADNAVSWQRKNNGLGNFTVRALALDGSLLFAGTSAGLFVSSNNGETWQSGSTMLAGSLVKGLAVSGNTIIASTGDQGICVSTDHGITWQQANQGLSGAATTLVSCDGLLVYAGSTLGGLYRRSLSEMLSSLSGLPVLDELPAGFLLHQNYPNPFNPTTTIRYGLPDRSHVTLIVFNTLGQQVAQLVDGDMDAGYHELRFDASGLSSGVYLYRMQVRPLDSAIGRDSKSGAGSYVDARKLVLLR